MRIIFTLFLFISTASLALGQNKISFPQIDQKVILFSQKKTHSLDDISSFINTHFSNEPAKVRAVYVWLAENIAYDVKALNLTPTIGKSENINSITMSTREAICQGYADLFKELCQRVGLKAHVITGYSKQDGFVSDLGHAWNTAQIDGKWFLFDPTWGAGYVSDNKFTKKFNDRYFMVKPADYIKTHYPSDPLWQLSSQPISAKEFKTGVKPPLSKTANFNFLDTLAAHEPGLNEQIKLMGMIRRIEAHGADLPFLEKELQHLKEGVNFYHIKAMEKSYNLGISQLNEFLYYRNKWQINKKRETELRELVSNTIANLKEAQQLSTSIPWPTNEHTTVKWQTDLDQALALAFEQELFLNIFLNPFGRKKKP